MKTLKPKLGRCLTCGRKGMQRRVLDVELDGGKRKVHDVEVDVCPHWGEQLYDSAAMRRIEAACPPRRRRSRRAPA